MYSLHLYTVNVEIFAWGVIFAFFTIFASLQKYPHAKKNPHDFIKEKGEKNNNVYSIALTSGTARGATVFR